MFLLNLYGSIFAENKVLILFNAKKDGVPQVLEYLVNTSCSPTSRR